MDKETVNKEADNEDFSLIVSGSFIHTHETDCRGRPERIVSRHACPDGRLFVWGTKPDYG